MLLEGHSVYPKILCPQTDLTFIHNASKLAVSLGGVGGAGIFITKYTGIRPDGTMRGVYSTLNLRSLSGNIYDDITRLSLWGLAWSLAR